MKFTDIFKHIYVINMDEHTDRWKGAQQELANIGIQSYHRFSGIKINGGKSLADRKYGCKQSHLKLLEKAKKETLSRNP